MTTPHHILHVDDSNEDRKLFSHAFTKSGLAGYLHSVGSTEDAMFFLRRTGTFEDAPRPRLIVLDLSFPNFDGIGLLELLRQHAEFKTIPVVILSGSDSHANRQRCRELGVEDYVLKPKSQQELAELIASLSRWLIDASPGLPTTNRRS
jgi:two-component system, chemotaxis family, response regulator Rcp1